MLEDQFLLEPKERAGFTLYTAVLNLWAKTPLGVAHQIHILHARYLYQDSEQ